MKRLLLLFAIAPILSYGQVTKVVTKKYVFPKDTEHYNCECNEQYEVLTANKKIKNGFYKRHISSTNTLIIEGFYKNDQKDSTWTYYHRQGKRISTGNYQDGKRVGIWNFYNPSGNKLEQSFNFDTHQLLSYRLDEKEKQRVFLVYTDTADIIVKPDRPPLYIGGSTALRLLLETQYQPFSNNIRALSIVTYDIDTDGKTSNFRVLKSVSKEIDESTMKLALLLKDSWLPCIYEGKPVKCRQEFTTNYYSLPPGVVVPSF